MANTLRERYISALTARGCQVVNDGRVRSSIKMTRDEKTFYFLGPSGSLRYGQTVADSRPVNDAFKYKLLLSLLPNSETIKE
jgi:hypothetical protein